MIRMLVLALVLLGGTAVAPAMAAPVLPADGADIVTDEDLDVGEEMC